MKQPLLLRFFFWVVFAASVQPGLAQTACEPIAGLVARFPFDEGQGAPQDATGQVGAGTLTGGTWQPGGGHDGGGALALDGSDRLHIPLNWHPAAFSYSFWVEPTGYYNGSQGTGGEAGWGSFVFESTYEASLNVGTDKATALYLPLRGFLQYRTWQHFVFTFANGVGTLYKNGLPFASKAGMTPPTPWQGVRFVGPALYDELRIYDRAVSPLEALQLYQCAGPPSPGPPLCSATPVQVSPDATLQAGQAVTLQLRPAGPPPRAALQFDGDADLVLVSSPATAPATLLSDVVNNFTVEAWVNPSAVCRIDKQDNTGTSGTYAQHYLIYPAYGGAWGEDHAGMGISVGTNAVSVYENAASYMPPILVWQGAVTGWTHLAVVYQNRRPTLYINGQPVAQGALSQKAYVHPSLGIGGGSYGYYQGQANEVRIWSEARTAAQIQALYQHAVTAPAPTLAGCWHLDEGSGSAAADASGHQLTGSLTKFPINGYAGLGYGPQWQVPSTAPITPGVAYAWSPAAGLDRTDGPTVVARPAATTTYTVTAAGAANCSSSQATVTVTVSGTTPLPPDNPSANREKNWTLERSFDGNGNVVAESKQFTDALGRPTQAQARNAATQQVFAAQTVYSTGGQPVLQTLAAPINNQSFNYKEGFLTASGQPYGPTNFEDAKASAPDAVDATSPLGKYFSALNDLEPLTPITSYPYSLMEPYEGPLGGTKRAAGPGDELRMGTGREGKGRDFVLCKEFDHYVQLRPQFVPGSALTTLAYQGLKSVSVNADGRESIVVTNKEGQALVSCLSGPQYPALPVAGYLSTDPTNSLDPNAPPYQDVHIPAAGPQVVTFTNDGTVRVTDLLTDASQDYASPGPATLDPGFYRLASLGGTQGFSYDAHYGNFSYTYYDDAGRVVATVAPNGLLDISSVIPSSPTTAPPIAAGTNLLLNSDFEQDQSFTFSPSSWLSTGTANTSYSETTGGAHSGNYHGTQWKGDGTYQAYTYQVATNLPNGLYTLRAWFKNNGGQTEAVMLARNYGGDEQKVALPVTNSNWEWALIEIKDIAVTSGQCEIGFRSVTTAPYQCIYFDDVQLLSQGVTVPPPVPNTLLNPGFEQEQASTTTPSSWLSTGTAGTFYSETYGGAHSGNYHGTQWKGDGTYQAYTYQVATNLPNGLYTLRAWFKNSGGQTEAVMLARNYGGDEQKIALPVTYNGGGGAWASIELKDIAVTNGQCEIGFRSVTTAPYQCIYFDDVQLLSQAATVTTGLQFVTRNTYDTSGRLLATESTGEGRTEYVYARDGRIRFSQSALQQPAGRFSYSNYDEVGRVVESGEYTPGDAAPDVFENHLTASSGPTSVLRPAVLESRDAAGGISPDGCAQRNQVWYDLPWDGTADPQRKDAQINGRTQEFVLGAVAKTQNERATTWYSYDELGRVTWVVQQLPGVGVKTLDYTYDFSGNVLEVAYQAGQPDGFHHYYTYDAAQRLGAVYTSPDGTARTLQAAYTYYLHGPLKRVQVAGDLQGIDYTYTLQGWLKSINDANQSLDPGQDTPTDAQGQPKAGGGTYKDLFGLTLDYFSGDYASRQLPVATAPAVGGPTPLPTRYDGTIRLASWRTDADRNVHHQVAYAYDEKSQLSQSTYGLLTLPTPTTPARFTPSTVGAGALREGGLRYDPNGNLLALQRTDQNGLVTDNFSYVYKPNANQLASVHTGTADGSTVIDYDYDALGQMTRQTDEQGPRYLTYDVSGKTTGVYADEAHAQPLVLFAYDDRGFRVSKAGYDPASHLLLRTTYYVRDVAGNVLSVYEQAAASGSALVRTEVPLYGSGRLGTLTRLDDGTDDYRYELNDHLGNARVVFHRPTTARYDASMETERASQEEQDFRNVVNTRFTGPVSHSSNKVSLLGMYSGQPTGPSKTLTVQKGDTITFSAFAWLTAAAKTGTGQPRPNAFTFAPVLLSGTGNAPPGENGGSANPLIGLGVGAALTLGGGGSFPGQLNALDGTTSNVYLRYRVLDADGQEITRAGGAQEADGARLANWQQLQVGLRLQQAGTVELSVEVDGLGPDVYVDDVAVEQTGGLIVQEQHPYAFGAPLPGLSYTVGNKRYRHGYQGQYAEHDAETGWENFDLRLYNSRVGRWMSYDPEGQFDSPYVGMGNNPVSGVDPTGGISFGGGGGFFSSLKEFAARVAQGFNEGAPVALEGFTVVGHRAGSAAMSGLRAGSNILRAGNDALNGGVGEVWNRADNASAFARGLLPFTEGHSWQGIKNTGVTAYGYANDYYFGNGKMTAMAALNGMLKLGQGTNDFFDSSSSMTNYQRGGIVTGLAIDVGTEALGEGEAFYSVAYETKIPSNLYPGMRSRVHFKAANEALRATIESNAGFAQSMSDLGVSVPSNLYESPANWVWHHHADPGKLQLVPKAQHTLGSSYWNTLHTHIVNGRRAGGMAIWGRK